MDQENDNVLDLKGSEGKESYLARMERAREKRISKANAPKNIPLGISPRKSTPSAEQEEEIIEDAAEFQELPTRTPPKKKTRFSQSVRDSVERVGSATAILMVGLAIFYDLAQFLLNLIPVLGNILSSILIGPFAWLSFYVWFKIKGVDFSRPKRSLSLVGAGVIEMIPILNMLPAWTLAVLVLIATTKIEDMSRNRSAQKASFESGRNSPA